MTREERAELERWSATVPVDDEELTPEQEAEFAAIVAEFEAGRAPMVTHEDVPAVLEAMARARRAA